jgi:hypothetical protein
VKIGFQGSKKFFGKTEKSSEKGEKKFFLTFLESKMANLVINYVRVENIKLMIINDFLFKTVFSATFLLISKMIFLNWNNLFLL